MTTKQVAITGAGRGIGRSIALARIEPAARLGRSALTNRRLHGDGEVSTAVATASAVPNVELNEAAGTAPAIGRQAQQGYPSDGARGVGVEPIEVRHALQTGHQRLTALPEPALRLF